MFICFDGFNEEFCKLNTNNSNSNAKLNYKIENNNKIQQNTINNNNNIKKLETSNYELLSNKESKPIVKDKYSVMNNNNENNKYSSFATTINNNYNNNNITSLRESLLNDNYTNQLITSNSRNNKITKGFNYKNILSRQPTQSQITTTVNKDQNNNYRSYVSNKSYNNM